MLIELYLILKLDYNISKKLRTLRFMDKVLVIIFVGVLSLCVVSAKAQDTAYSYKNLRYITTENYNSDTLLLNKLDTGLKNIQIYYPTFLQKNLYLYLGNIGTAATEPFYRAKRGMGFSFKENVFDVYFTKDKDIKYYRTKAPFTQLKLITGSKVEQNFYITHSQNIRPNWNIGFNYNRQTSTGKYLRQKTDWLGFDIFTWYSSRNARYHLLSNFILNRIRVQENGGLVATTTINRTLDATLLPVNLNNTNAQVVNREVNLKQMLDFGTKIVLDSNKYRIKPSSRLSFENKLSQQVYIYNETLAEAAYYPTTTDSARTYDLSTVDAWENTLAYNILPKHDASSLSFFGEIAAKNHYFKQANAQNDRIYGNATAGGAAGIQKNSSNLYLKHSQILLDAFAGDNTTEIIANTKINDYYYINIGIYNIQKSVELMWQNYTSNHYKWANDFNKTNLKGAYFSISKPEKNITINAQYDLTADKIFFLNQRPVQIAETIKTLTIDLKKEFIAKHISFSNTLTFQTNTAKKITLPYSNFYYYGNLNFPFTAVKNVLNLQPGIDFRYLNGNSTFGYNPALAAFTLNGSPTNNFLVADVYISAVLKRAKFFIRYENFSELFITNKQEFVSGFPIQPRVLKVSICWDFFN